jgi:hypothetical protein
LNPTAVILIVISAIFLGGCWDPGDADRIGVEVSATGAITIHYAACKDDVRVMRLVVARSGQLDSPIWEIRSESSRGEPVLGFVVGQPALGFDTIIPLEQPLALGRYLIVVDSSELKDRREGFEFGALQVGRVLTPDGDYMTSEEFRGGALC